MKEEMNLSDLWGGCIWCSSKPQTNADRIRQMSDEELAEYLGDIAGWLSEYEGKAHALLKWLKAPVDKEEEGWTTSAPTAATARAANTSRRQTK